MLTIGCRGAQPPTPNEPAPRDPARGANQANPAAAHGSASAPAANSGEPKSLMDILEHGAQTREGDAGAPWGRELDLNEGAGPLPGPPEPYWGNHLTPDGGTGRAAHSSAQGAPASPRVPPVRLVDVAVTGSLHGKDQRSSVLVARRILRQRLYGYVRMCYDSGLNRKSMLRGTVTARQLLRTDGSVADVSDDGSSLPDAQVVDCVLKGLSRPAFPDPAAGTSVRSTWQLTPPSGAPRKH